MSDLSQEQALNELARALNVFECKLKLFEAMSKDHPGIHIEQSMLSIAKDRILKMHADYTRRFGVTAV